jgi:hypothetical protein
MFEKIVERFAQGAPAATLFRATFARVYSAEKLNEVFRHNKQRQVEGVTLFSSLMELLAPVVYGAKPSVNASYDEMRDHLGVSKAAVYDKLQGIEPQVSSALVSECVGELAIIQAQARTLAEGPLPGYHVYVIDGKRLDGTQHRLKETRRLKSSPLPGTVVAMYDTQLELFIDAACDPDCYACERKVVEPMLERLGSGGVYMADRNFCDGFLIERFLRQGAFYLLRQHGRSPRWRFSPGKKRRFIGRDEKGDKVFEEPIEVYLPSEERWASARRIVVELANATRSGDRVLYIITNLPPSVSAIAIANAYRGRWTIETSLGYIAQALNAEINTLAYPGAALLSFCLGLMLFNLVRTVEKLLLHYSQAEESSATPRPRSLSHYYMTHEILAAHRGIQIVIPDSYWERFARMPLSAFLAFVEHVASTANLRKYRKNVRGPKRPPPKRQSGKGRAHVSAHRILLAR